MRLPSVEARGRWRERGEDGTIVTSVGGATGTDSSLSRTQLDARSLP